MAIAAVGGDRALNKPPLIRSAQAFGPTTLEIAWSTDETLPLGCVAPTRTLQTSCALITARPSRRVQPDEWGHSGCSNRIFYTCLKVL